MLELLPIISAPKDKYDLLLNDGKQFYIGFHATQLYPELNCWLSSEDHDLEIMPELWCDLGNLESNSYWLNIEDDKPPHGYFRAHIGEYCHKINHDDYENWYTLDVMDRSIYPTHYIHLDYFKISKQLFDFSKKCLDFNNE